MTTPTYPDLDGRGVIVTGGASGIGAAIVEAFVHQGAQVGFLDFDKDASTALVASLRTPRVRQEVCDLRDIDAMRKAIGRLAAEMGGTAVLVNNAARDDRHALQDVTPAYWDERFDTNLRHQFFAAQAVAPGMAAAGGGSIINLGSISWMMGQSGMICYTTAKSAVQGLTRSLARELGPQKIRVNSVLPGWVMTERQIKLWLTPEGKEDLLRRQCLKRTLTPNDVAQMVLFLASGASAGCTGQSYIVDGGMV